MADFEAKIKPPEQVEHLSKPIEDVHIFGDQAKDPKIISTDTKMASDFKLPSYANDEGIEDKDSDLKK